MNGRGGQQLRSDMDTIHLQLGSVSDEVSSVKLEVSSLGQRMDLLASSVAEMVAEIRSQRDEGRRVPTAPDGQRSAVEAALEA